MLLAFTIMQTLAEELAEPEASPDPWNEAGLWSQNFFPGRSNPSTAPKSLSKVPSLKEEDKY